MIHNDGGNYGGGIYFDRCPSRTLSSFNVYIINNTASIAGGAYYLRENNCKWCIDERSACVVESNTDLDGSDLQYSTVPVLMQVEWNVPSKFTPLDHLGADTSLYDGYGNIVATFEYETSAVISVSQNDLEITGTSTSVFTSGVASVSFGIASHHSNPQAESITVNLTLSCNYISSDSEQTIC